MEGMTVRRIPGLAVLTSAAPALLLTACLTTRLSACGANGGDTQAPSAPAGVTVHASSSTSVHVMWSRSTDDVEVAGYEVYEGSRLVKKVTGERYMVDVAGLKPSAVYTFTVRARDAAGNLSMASKDIRVTTLSAAAADDREPPTRPGRLRGRADGGRAATLTWGKSTDNVGVASYDIYQGDAKIHSVSGDETTALLTGLRPGTDYTFTVRARDSADNGSPAARALDLTTAPGPGGGGTAPTGFRAKTHAAAGKHYLDLSWVPPKTGGEIAAYEIYLDGKFATTLTWGAAPPKGRATHSFYVGEQPGTTYSVKIRAKLPDGTWGSFSPQRTVTTARR
ncbi:fibronectin type III domain-containing protein [Streptomyces sp. 7N604]|uniref:fibronectin type III domain-containing protein n=1 Tax=Streptomyces sp. 7N604 TaxID=3457415 RepID=UPI003FCF2658